MCSNASVLLNNNIVHFQLRTECISSIDEVCSNKQSIALKGDMAKTTSSRVNCIVTIWTPLSNAGIANAVLKDHVCNHKRRSTN